MTRRGNLGAADFDLDPIAEIVEFGGAQFVQRSWRSARALMVEGAGQLKDQKTLRHRGPPCAKNRNLKVPANVSGLRALTRQLPEHGAQAPSTWKPSRHQSRKLAAPVFYAATAISPDVRGSQTDASVSDTPSLVTSAVPAAASRWASRATSLSESVPTRCSF